MTKVRILGPRDALSALLPILQDYGQLHLADSKESAEVHPLPAGRDDERRARGLGRLLEAIRAALRALAAPRRKRRLGAPVSASRETLAQWARLARTVRAQAVELTERRRSLEEERAFLSRYRQFFGMFESLAKAAAQWPGAAVYHVILPEGGPRSLGMLREGLRDTLGDQFEIWSRELDAGETGVLILVPRAMEQRVEELFVSAGVQEVALPGSEQGLGPAEAIPHILERLEAIPRSLRTIDESLDLLRRKHAGTLSAAEACVVDELARLEALERAGATDHAFVLEGWVPTSELAELEHTLARRLGDTTVVEVISREEWRGEDVPVVLRNPRLFRPFETLVRILPLPRYGTIDPTPFLAIFFPMFFGLVLGDVGYGLLLGLAALILARKAPEGPVRSVAKIAGACAAFAVVFGVLYGEFFGDAGAAWFGMEPLALDREESLLPFLALALAIGVVHTLLGLVLALISSAREGARAAIGPGVTLVMVVLVVGALLAAFGVLPRSFFTPAVLIVLVLFPVLVTVEGVLGPTELVSTFGHILSYARVMAVGTASVMMAVAANRMVGAVGSVVVGALFALLFHLVNFALGVFSPTIHALRLHFVEFFGTFYSPGGTRYEPFRHWAPVRGSHPTEE